MRSANGIETVPALCSPWQPARFQETAVEYPACEKVRRLGKRRAFFCVTNL
jgi:hypothetical protein